MKTFLGLFRYKRYILSLICLTTMIAGCIIHSKTTYLLRVHLLIKFTRIIELLNAFSLSISVVFVYGLKRLSDDIHFFTGSQPTKFWKICWVFLPVATIVPSVYYVLKFRLPNTSLFIIIYLIIFLLVFVPVPALLGLEILNHMKLHHLTGLLQPHERWGPADPEERYMRLIYNPREETRIRRRQEKCQHDCLLHNKYVEKFMAAESQLRIELKSTTKAKVNKTRF